MLFLFVHCFVINLVNGLHNFLCKVLGLFNVKIHIPYIPAYKSISRSTYKSTRHWPSKNVQNLTPAYKSTLGRDLRLRAAGGDIRTGHVAVAERPAMCKQCRDAAVATCDDALEAGRWVVRWRWR